MSLAQRLAAGADRRLADKRRTMGLQLLLAALAPLTAIAEACDEEIDTVVDINTTGT